MRQLALLLLIPACFGEGPEPTLPSEATILFSVPRPTQQHCSNSRFIGDVALGTGKGYALTLPYVPNNNNCGDSGPGGAPVITIPVSSFGMTTSSSIQVGTAGQSDPYSGTRPHIAAAGDLAAWTYLDRTTSQSGEVVVSTSAQLTTKLPMSNGFFLPIAMTADATAFYVAGVQTSGFNGKSSDVNDPTYPCCGTYGTPGDISSHIYKVTPAGAVTTLPTAPKFNYLTLKSALVSNSTSLFFTEYAQPINSASATLVNGVRKDGSLPVMLGMIPSSQGVPVGLGASDSYVAWASSVKYENPPYPDGFCNVGAYDLAAGMAIPTLYHGDFSCLDAAVDATHVYFAIVDITSNGSENMFGIGIGRVSLADKTFESIRIGTSGAATGPRRVYLDGENIYAVDPFVIASIKKSALVGKHDF